MNKIDKLIINGPYKVPTKHWKYDRETLSFDLVDGRRPAGFMKATPGARGFNDPGTFEPIELVEEIRELVDVWRQNGYPGITITSRKLLEYWQDRQDPEQWQRRFFFCQLEAIETLIWLVETPEGNECRQNIKGDGGPLERLCSKLATGTGKTVVMAMIIAWNFLNKITNPDDERFSKYVLIVAPGLTVKERLQVLQPSAENNYYTDFEIVPTELMQRLRQGKVLICNWHSLAWDSQEKLDAKAEKGQLRSVDKRRHRELSGEAYIKQVLGADLATATDLLVINDEAHHAWRLNPGAKGKYKRIGTDKDSAEEATVWIGGLDKIHKQRGILRCFDLSATPFTSSGARQEASLFNWIVSDFGLNDAIESGLVKTPRVAIRDDSKLDENYKSRLYHIYNDLDVKDDLSRVGKQVQETEPLPDLVTNAYALLGSDWLEIREKWLSSGHGIPPVMITVANNTKTSARIRYAFEQESIEASPQLRDEEGLLQIDSNVLKAAEESDEQIDLTEQDQQSLTQKEKAELLRRKVNTVGVPDAPGEKVCNVISVGMLSEGWDAKNVTNIMGLRRFSSQLLCEQVVGRGLRRISYDEGEDGLFQPEYVNIFGVPFTFLPHEGNGGEPPPPPPPATRIEPLAEKQEHKIRWPNVVRIDYAYKPRLEMDWNNVKPFTIDPFELITEADLDVIVDGQPHDVVRDTIDLACINERTRLQTIVFKIAKSIYNNQGHDKWKGDSYSFLVQLIPLIEQFIYSDKVTIKNDMFKDEEEKKKILIMLNMNAIIKHLWKAILDASTEDPTPVFDQENPILSTGDMRPWYTTKPCEAAGKSHISHCVYDSKWEASEAYTLNKSGLVKSFVKNDHLYFVIFYNFNGVVHKYYPDYLIRLTDNDYLVLEVKGQDNAKVKAKAKALDEWCTAVNAHGGFGHWQSAISYHPTDLKGILAKHRTQAAAA
ncbi:MAG: BPTD_3080 family restriction endonuclease [Pseudohongiellaceae bacterium]